MDKFKELTKKYVQLTEEYKKYVSQFLSAGWVDDGLSEPKKVLSREALDKIKELKREVDDVHNEWLKMIGSRENN